MFVFTTFTTSDGEDVVAVALASDWEDGHMSDTFDDEQLSELDGGFSEAGLVVSERGEGVYDLASPDAVTAREALEDVHGFEFDDELTSAASW